MSMKIFRFLILIGIIAFIFNGCYVDKEEYLYRFSNTFCDTSNVTYSGDISQIISANCLVCHSGSSASGTPQVSLDNYSGTKVVASNGKLLDVVNFINKPMPPSGKLDDCSIAKIRIWVNAGSPNN